MGNDRVTLGLSIGDIPSEELFDLWQDLLALRVRADAHLAELGVRLDKAEGFAEWKPLFARLEMLWPSYQVLSAWTDVVHAAYVFATEGYESLFMDDEFTTSEEYFPF
jgi:hypothetical protein